MISLKSLAMVTQMFCLLHGTVAVAAGEQYVVGPSDSASFDPAFGAVPIKPRSVN